MEDITIKSDSTIPNLVQNEEKILKFWEEKNILEKSIHQRDGSKSFTFYDGPITANNMPHYGHVLTMVIKDVVPRYKTMKGFKVERSLGWDCQGIPVEYEVEKQLGFEQKRDIEKFGVEKFNQLCRESVKKYQGAIMELTKRMGRWVNSDEEYATMDSKYIESIWWSLKELYEKGLLYEGYKVVPYSTRAGTTLSNSEVALGGYETIVDPAVVVKLKLIDSNTYLLIWTTTPWTLPGNLLVAVGKDFDYVEVEYKGERYIVGEKLAKNIFKDDYTVLRKFKGSELIGKEYEPLYPYYKNKRDEGAFRVVHAEHVTLDEGTGLVHQAPYGEEDFVLMSDMGIGMFDYLDDQGNMKDEITQFAGMFYKKANKYIMQDLQERGLLFDSYDYEHQMPMCWRTHTPLIYKPIKSWYIRVTEIKELLVSENEKTNWIPKHFKEGRFGNWLADARDWALSRNRYWGTPLPVWICDKCGKKDVIGSFGELKQKSGVEITDPHKPFVDEIAYKCECGGQMRRVNDVIDVWYDSGSMPFARFHYPFENEEKFKEKFPAEFIGEGVDQTRGWFYTLHVLGCALFGSRAFNNVIVNGMALAPDGTKMSKSKRNYPEVDSVINSMGADALRLYFLSSPIVHGQDVIFNDSFVKEIISTVILPYYNCVKYFLSYKEQFKWKEIESFEPEHVMDRWIFAMLNKTIKDVTRYMDKYNLQGAVKSIFDLIDVLSKWYIRRGRERFVNGDVQALNTLYIVLVQTSKLLAPFAPFISESGYLSLVTDKKESVHLEDYPVVENKYIDSKLLENMSVVREICSLGLNIRDEYRIKLRQPLSQAYVSIKDEEMQGIIKGELNIKEVIFSNQEVSGDNIKSMRSGDNFVSLDINVSEELLKEGMLNEILRALQVARKEKGCKVGEFVNIEYTADSKEILSVIQENREKIMKEIHITSMSENKNIQDGKLIKIGDGNLSIVIL